MPVIDMQQLIIDRVESIRQYHKECGMKRAQIDVSGGVDSAVILGLVAKAIGPENITAIYSDICSSDESSRNASLVADTFGVDLCKLDLTSIFSQISNICINNVPRGTVAETIRRKTEDPCIDGSLRSCLRAPIGRYMNRLLGNGIRHGTGNECEDRWLRFYQKGGDGEVDTNPIGFLSKGEVYQLARALGVPNEICETEPTPDLHNASSHTDEQELMEIYQFPWTYSRVNPEGDYIKIGTIEIMSRLLSSVYDGKDVIGRNAFDELLFIRRPISKNMIDFVADYIVNFLDSFKIMTNRGMEIESIAEQMVTQCQSIERDSRHKVNPNIPQFGTRISLLESGILSDALPFL